MSLFAPLNPRMADWRGRRVWLVGASSGIGRATAVDLHARGATVYVSARNVAALGHFVAQCKDWPFPIVHASRYGVSEHASDRNNTLQTTLLSLCRV